MEELIAKAKHAASQLFDDVEDAKHVLTHATGIAVFEVSRRTGEKVTVTLNPNGLGAGVEWGCKKLGSGYRTFRLQGNLPNNLLPQGAP